MTAKQEELQLDLSAKNADAHQLQTQLKGSQSQLQSTQRELQQRTDAHSSLESQVNAQTAEIESGLERVGALMVDKQQLQISLESHQAEAAEQLSKAIDQAQQLQVTHTVIMAAAIDCIATSCPGICYHLCSCFEQHLLKST